MVKIALIGIVSMLLCVMLGKIRSEYSVYIAIIGSVIIFFLGIQKAKGIFDAMEQLKSYLGIHESYLSILLKMIGIAYIAEFASSLCKDAGQAAIANQIDFVGKISMLVISIPILTSLLETMGEFLP